MTNYKEVIISIEPITRKKAKYYTKYCGYCKEYFNSKKPLFYLFTKDINQDNIKEFSINTHIYTLENLNKRIWELQKKNGIKS